MMINKVKKLVELLCLCIVFDAPKKIEVKNSGIAVVKWGDTHHEYNVGNDVCPFRGRIYHNI